jgi:hypothetical protein
MTELSEIGPLGRSRRGVSIGTLLIWMMIAGAGGAVAWDIYGNELRSRLGIFREGAPSASANEPAPEMPANGDVVALVKDLQASQKRTADQLETALQMLTSEQAASRTMADTLAALGAKVDGIQRPPAAVPAAKRPAPAAPVAAVAPPRRPPLAAPRPIAPNPGPDTDQPDPAPGAPTGNRQ